MCLIPILQAKHGENVHHHLQVAEAFYTIVDGQHPQFTCASCILPHRAAVITPGALSSKGLTFAQLDSMPCCGIHRRPTCAWGLNMLSSFSAGMKCCRQGTGLTQHACNCMAEAQNPRNRAFALSLDHWAMPGLRSGQTDDMPLRSQTLARDRWAPAFHGCHFGRGSPFSVCCMWCRVGVHAARGCNGQCRPSSHHFPRGRPELEHTSLQG